MVNESRSGPLGFKINLCSSSWAHVFVVEVENELMIIKDAPHFEEMFDVDEVRSSVMALLNAKLQ